MEVLSGVCILAKSSMPSPFGMANLVLDADE